MSNEEWRPVVGWEGLYEVSNTGRVRSLTRRRMCGNHYATCKGRELNQIKSKTGYLVVVLSNGTKDHKPHYIHRLVAEAFIPNPENHLSVDHINCDKHDNRVENLRWCSLAQNTKYQWENGIANGFKPGNRASAHVCSKPVVRDDGRWYPSVTAAAKELGGRAANVSAVLRGKACTYKGFSFQYA